MRSAGSLKYSYSEWVNLSTIPKAHILLRHLWDKNDDRFIANGKNRYNLIDKISELMSINIGNRWLIDSHRVKCLNYIDQ